MKHFKLLIISLLAVLIAGCGKSSSPSTDTTTDQQLDKLKQDTAQAAQDLKDYTYTQKDAFVQKMQVVRDELNQELTELSAKMDHASADAKTAAQPKLDALKAQIAALDVELDKAKNSTEATWADVKTGAQTALDKTTAAFEEAGQWIDKQFSS
jgi:hypothetical protein